STTIQFVISVQYDCQIGHCQPAVVGKERQEYEDTSQDKSLIKHMDDDHFLINMGALHNFTETLSCPSTRIDPAQTTVPRPH
ncbi:hypothetical protein B0H14DRAFT_2400441, partial [Mycena olivaceomarginata]